MNKEEQVISYKLQHYIVWIIMHRYFIAFKYCFKYVK